MNELVRSAPAATPRKAAPAEAPAKAASRPPQRDAERTMANILEVATREFADKGLAGGRIDAIAEATRTSKRMIYYYFESKEGLYLAVLEEAYRRIREIESTLCLQDLAPQEALRTLVGFTVDYQAAHPEFIRLVMNENIHRGAFIAGSPSIRQLNVPAIAVLRNVLERGQRAGVFRADLDPVDVHMSISALSFFNVANRHTFGAIFQIDFDDAQVAAARRASIVDMVMRSVEAK